ncbi:unnamed protein product [Schistosoma margrebowiei]|uniref:Matrix-remodeling-associated protein 7 helical domain-containing protein n=1 Tax=Schistosoma margrebowiei TaxID=48269 RepID=A0AA85ALN2_9TREM|nr:unnamed protein product [Schistosoma margrebowiei]
MQSKQNSFHKHPSFVKSTEEFEKLLLQCPFMSIIHSSKINKNKLHNKINKKSINDKQDQSIKSNDIIFNNQLSIISNENCIKINQSKDNSNKNDEMIIKDTKMNHIEYQPENHNQHNENMNEHTITNMNYLNSLSSIKKLRLTKEFNSLSIDEQNEENELRYKQLNKLYELIQSDPGSYGQLSIENIIEQMNHFYL